MQPSKISPNEIFSYTDNKLKAHIENNKEFDREFIQYNMYYQELLGSKVKPTEQETFTNLLFNAIKSQIFNGYFLFRELLEKESTMINDEWYTQAQGKLITQIPNIIKEASGENYIEVVTSTTMREFITWMIKRYEDVLPILNNMSLHCASLGFKWAIIDERDRKGLQPYIANIEGYLGLLDDITFIHPQYYIVADLKNDALTEKWALFDFLNQEKLGDIWISLIKGDSPSSIVSLYFKYTLSDKVQQTLVETISATVLLNTGVQRNNLTINYAVTNEFLLI